jgi:hypothetical protein
LGKWGLVSLLFGLSVSFVLAGTLCIQVAEIPGVVISDCYSIGDQPDQDFFFDCIDIWPCEPCGLCHAESKKDLAKSWVTNSLSDHQKERFKKVQFVLPAGRKYKTKNFILIAENRKLIKYIPKDRKAILFPVGSMILKNKAGNPGLIYSPSKPKVVSRSIKR